MSDSQKTKYAVLLLSLLVLCGLALYAIQDKHAINSMEDGNSKDILSLVTHLESSYPASTKEDLENVLHSHFSENGGNEYFAFYKGGSSALIAQAELRYSKTNPASKILILDVQEPTGLSEDDIRKQYPDAVPSGGPAQGFYLVEKEAWGEVRFGFDDSKNLARLVFDSVPDATQIPD